MFKKWGLFICHFLPDFIQHLNQKNWRFKLFFFCFVSLQVPQQTQKEGSSKGQIVEGQSYRTAKDVCLLLYNKLLNIKLVVMSFWVSAATVKQLYGCEIMPVNSFVYILGISQQSAELWNVFMYKLIILYVAFNFQELMNWLRYFSWLFICNIHPREGNIPVINVSYQCSLNVIFIIEYIFQINPTCWFVS